MHNNIKLELEFLSFAFNFSMDFKSSKIGQNWDLGGIF